MIRAQRGASSPPQCGRSVLWAKQDSLLLSSLHLDAVGLDGGVVLEGLVDDAPIEGAEGLQFHNITPTTHFFSSFLGLLDEGFASLSAIAADIDHDFWRRWILLKKQPVGDVLQI